MILFLYQILECIHQTDIINNPFVKSKMLEMKQDVNGTNGVERSSPEYVRHCTLLARDGSGCMYSILGFLVLEVSNGLNATGTRIFFIFPTVGQKI